MSAPVVKPVGFGVIGANSFVANAAVLPAIRGARNARVAATASLSAPVQDRWADTDVDDYDAVIEHPDVEAVYIPLPNGMHRRWTERAAAAGKHVLCEKPLAPDVDTARSMADSCETAGVLLGEAWMTPFDRRWAAAMDMARSGAIGAIQSQHHRFTFTIGSAAADNYRWDPGQGGGALLDVGIYCIGTAVELWGPECAVDTVRRRLASSGVDASTRVRLRWSHGRSADIECSFVDDEQQIACITGADARIVLEHAAFTSGHDSDGVIERIAPDGTSDEIIVTPGNPYQTMVEAFSDAVRGNAEWPRPIERSIELLTLLERIADTPATCDD